MKWFCLYLFILIAPLSLYSFTIDNVTTYCPNVCVVKGDPKLEELMICCHGAGMDKMIAHTVRQAGHVPCHLVAFNFPTHGENIKNLPLKELIFGCPEELYPLLSLLRCCVIDAEAEKVHLYGFSAGGGALINALVALKNKNSLVLDEVGISESDADEILVAVQKGIVILDCPLKSLEEVAAFRGGEHPLFAALQQQYFMNQMEPIVSVQRMDGLPLNLIVHFENPDDKLSNRDDALFIERIQKANEKGHTEVIIGNEGKHAPCLSSLVTLIEKAFALPQPIPS